MTSHDKLGAKWPGVFGIKVAKRSTLMYWGVASSDLDFVYLSMLWVKISITTICVCQRIGHGPLLLDKMSNFISVSCIQPEQQRSQWRKRMIIIANPTTRTQNSSSMCVCVSIGLCFNEEPSLPKMSLYDPKCPCMPPNGPKTFLRGKIHDYMPYWTTLGPFPWPTWPQRASEKAPGWSSMT